MLSIFGIIKLICNQDMKTTILEVFPLVSVLAHFRMHLFKGWFGKEK